MKRIDILYFEGCPNHEPAAALARSVCDELGIDAEINEIEILGPEDAETHRFLGSPSIRVNDIDIEPSARQRSDFGFSCRTYSGKGVPDHEMLAAALRDEAGSIVGMAPEASQANCCASDSAPHKNPPQGAWRLGALALAGSVIAAAAASACCWLPLLLVAFGFSVGSVGAIFETTRPYFLTVAAVLLSAGFYFAYIRKPECEPGASCETGGNDLRRMSRVMLWVSAAAVTAFALFPLYAGAFVADPIEAVGEATDGASRTIDLQIDGMTCAGCAVNVHNALMKVPGVLEARIDFESSRAYVTTATKAEIPEATLITAIRNAGYRARPVNNDPNSRAQRPGDEK